MSHDHCLRSASWLKASRTRSCARPGPTAGARSSRRFQSVLKSSTGTGLHQLPVIWTPTAVNAPPEVNVTTPPDLVTVGGLVATGSTSTDRMLIKPVVSTSPELPLTL